MKLLILFFLTISNSPQLDQDRFTIKNEINEVYYVWAKNGLNLRSSPTVEGKIITHIPFGDNLTFLKKTEHKYINKFVENGKFEKNPILLRSNWVRVKYKDLEGYLIDGYLLNLKCPDKNENIEKYLIRIGKENGFEKLKKKVKYEFGKITFNCSQINLPEGKRISFQNSTELKNNKKQDASSVEFFWYFKGFTANEVLIFMNPFFDIEHNEGSPFKVQKNWEEKIVLLNYIEEISIFVLPNEEIIFYYFTSC